MADFMRPFFSSRFSFAMEKNDAFWFNREFIIGSGKVWLHFSLQSDQYYSHSLSNGFILMMEKRHVPVQHDFIINSEAGFEVVAIGLGRSLFQPGSEGS